MSFREPHTADMREQRDNIAAVEPPMIDYMKLEAHPLAETFRMMNDDELEGLMHSIRERGIRVPITLYQDGGILRILDGRNRYKAALEVSHPFSAKDFKPFEGTYEEAEDFVLETNAARRQMSADDKVALVKRMIEKYPSRTNRHIARLCSVSHVTVGKYREPEIDKTLVSFVKAWGKLNPSQRKSFAEKFKGELQEAWTA